MSAAVRKKRKIVSLKKTTAYSNYKKREKAQKSGKKTNDGQTSSRTAAHSRAAAPKEKTGHAHTAKEQKRRVKQTKSQSGRIHLSQDIGIDLGTSNIKVFVKDRGIVFNEPAVVALDKESGEVVAVGNAARNMLKINADKIEAIRPISGGVIADYDVAEKTMQYFIEQACGRNWIIKPRIMVCLPADATGVEEKAIRLSALQSGARQAFLIDRAIAAGIGVGVDIHGASGNLIIDIGGGTTDIAVIALDGTVCGRTLRIGGENFNQSIVKNILRDHQILIGESCAEAIKCAIGTAIITENNKKNSVKVTGADTKTGKQRTITYTAKECNNALMEHLSVIVNTVNEVLEEISPELLADIIAKGLILTGGSSRLNNIAMLLRRKTQLHVSLAEDPECSVGLGIGKALEMLGRISSTGYYARGSS